MSVEIPPTSGLALLAHVKAVIEQWTAPPDTPTGVDASGRLTTLTAEQGAQLQQEVDGFHGRLQTLQDRLPLHDWIWGQPELQRAFCKYPGCFLAPRARRGASGSHPVYCEQSVEGVTHDLNSSFDLRQKLAKEASRREGTEVAVLPGVEVRDPNPVSRRITETLPAQVERMAQVFGGLVAEMKELRSSVKVIGDPEATLLEIDGIQHRAREWIEQQHAETLAARDETLTARRALTRNESLLEEQTTLTNETLQANTQLQAANEQLTADIDRVRTEAAEAVRTAHEEAEQLLQTEREQMAGTLTAEREQMADAVATAQAAQETAEQAARDAQAHATAKIAAADTAARNAETIAEQERDRSRLLDEDLRALRESMETRQVQHDQAVRELNAHHQQERENLNTTIAELRAGIEAQRANHDQAVAALHETHRADIDNLQRRHDEELRTLNATITQLRKDIDTLRVEHTEALNARDEAHRADLVEQLERQHALLSSAHDEVTEVLRNTIQRLRDDDARRDNPPGQSTP